MEPVLKYYTVADLKQWLLHNKPADGLSERIIAPTRAYAIMNNPYVKDEDAVVSAILEDGEPAAFTAAFPEILERPKGKLAWWFSTLYCRPESVGKGYGLIVVGQLCEKIGEGNFFDMDGAKETVEIFNYLGLTTAYSKRYIFSPKHINTKTLKGKLVYAFNYIKDIRRKHYLSKFKFDIDDDKYHVKYCSFVDDTTYNFMRNHSSSDMFFRSKEMFNWILTYPFLITSPMISNVHKDTQFTSNVTKYYIQLVSVYKGDLMIGVYIYRVLNDSMSVSYLYYDSNFDSVVFSSIAKHFIMLHLNSIRTLSMDFATWFKKFNFTEKMEDVNPSFSYPSEFNFSENLRIQQGDGDVFV